jgi:vitamin K-dependent gamma-carboxylase
VTRIDQHALTRRLLQPTDFAWLAAFRVLFGLTLAVSMWRFIANDWVTRFFVEPSFFFKYWGFGWVQPLSGPALHTLVVALGVLALAVAAGVAFRASSALLALGLTYLQLLDVSTYLNHYYLAGLLCWLLLASPAGRAWSFDAWISRRFLGRPPASQHAARAWLYLFRFQIALVYGFAALAKAQPDWLVHAQPLRIWLGASAELPLLGRLLAIDGVPLVMSWCGFLSTRPSWAGCRGGGRGRSRTPSCCCFTR